ncbi:MAG: energy transducer TonB [Spirochaetota bacterium]
MAQVVRRGGFRAVGIGLVTVAGFGLVVMSLVLMNRPFEEPEEKEQATAIDFTVPPEAPEPPESEPEPENREPRRSDQPALAPAPNLGSNLSGIQVSMPDFQPQGVSDVAESLLGDLDNVTLTEDAVDRAPVPQSKPLAYPERAKQRGIEGEVVVSVLVTRSGRVEKLRILQSKPPGVFDEAVQNSVPNWTFEPAKYEGEPVQTWGTLTIPFKLN